MKPSVPVRGTTSPVMRRWRRPRAQSAAKSAARSSMPDEPGLNGDLKVERVPRLGTAGEADVGRRRRSRGRGPTAASRPRCAGRRSTAVQRPVVRWARVRSEETARSKYSLTKAPRAEASTRSPAAASAMSDHACDGAAAGQEYDGEHAGGRHQPTAARGGKQQAAGHGHHEQGAPEQAAFGEQPAAVVGHEQQQDERGGQAERDRVAEAVLADFGHAEAVAVGREADGDGRAWKARCRGARWRGRSGSGPAGRWKRRVSASSSARKLML